MSGDCVELTWNYPSCTGAEEIVRESTWKQRWNDTEMKKQKVRKFGATRPNKFERDPRNCLF